MNDQLKQLLKLLGFSEEQVTQLQSTDAEELKKIDPKKMAAVVYDATKERLQNDDAFIEPLKVKIRGEVLEPRQRKARKLIPEITDEEYEALPVESKLDSLIELAVKKLRTTQAPDDAKKEIEKLRTKNQELADSLKKINEEIIPGIKAEADNTRNEIKIEQSVLTKLSKQKLKLEAEDAMQLILPTIRSKYDVKISDGNIKVLQKGKDLDAYGDDNKKITLESLVESAVAEKKLAAESQQTPPDRRQEPAGGGAGGGDRQLPPGLRKAQEKAEANTKKS